MELILVCRMDCKCNCNLAWQVSQNARTCHYRYGLTSPLTRSNYCVGNQSVAIVDKMCVFSEYCGTFSRCWPTDEVVRGWPRCMCLVCLPPSAISRAGLQMRSPPVSLFLLAPYTETVGLTKVTGLVSTPVWWIWSVSLVVNEPSYLSLNRCEVNVEKR